MNLAPFVILWSTVTAKGFPTCTEPVNSVFQIYSVNQAARICKLHSSLKKSLTKNDFTKVMCPFGVLIFADSGYPDDLLRHAANIVANLLDSDNSGNPDDSAVKNHLEHRGRLNKGAALVCGTSAKKRNVKKII